MKVQLTCFDISGRVYKQGLYADKTKAFQAHKRNSNKYGGYLRFEMVEVPDTQKKPLPVSAIGSQYCFCANTPLHVSKCSDCGKSPYTD
jgi:hypothetical protein